MSSIQATTSPEVVISAIITRKDGSIEDLGVIAVKQSLLNKIKQTIISQIRGTS